ncbi:putative Glycosyl transferase, family 2 [Nitrospira japonica]|uniref:Putative Glycosyl transferase, family 2 n=1 Tax=Nitrospira japonica TaxID=1325564 RepID=A0A1W1I095_9BACT|nr:glycosyltransferase [Nitrospira japonica]SLM46416.1 putative Glycosyl transferase, family 2 [Nitrospira japonica]
MPPKVSVVMSVYQGEQYLEEALRGVLNQTWRDYEFIIVDDGSTDDTALILNNHAERDRRIKLLKNEHNLGLTKSLNRALSIVQGEYVARQDADDVSMRRRLESQVKLMESRPQVGLVGTACRVIDAEGRALGDYVWPTSDTAIRWHMLFHNAFCHSSVMWRRSAFGEHEPRYDEGYRYSQDYALWTVLLRSAKAENLEVPLVAYRSHDRNIEATSRAAQQDSADNIAAQAIDELLGDELINRENLRTLRQWYNRWPDRLVASDRHVCALYLRILSAFVRVHSSRSGDMAEICRSVVERVLSSLTGSSPIELWRAGLAGTLLQLDGPFVMKFMGRGYWKRMKSLLRPVVRPAINERDTRRRL